MTIEMQKNCAEVAVQENGKRGFTLTEIAIVLGIIGLILGAIWTAASAVYQNMRTSKMNTALISISQGIRTLYATQTQTDGTNGTDLTAALTRSKTFPADMIVTPGNNNGVSGPWSNTQVHVYAAQQPTNGAVGDSFQILVSRMPRDACVSLLTSTTGQGRDSGLVALDVANGGAAAYITPNNATFPITVATANTTCANATDNVGWTFTLK